MSDLKVLRLVKSEGICLKKAFTARLLAATGT